MIKDFKQLYEKKPRFVKDILHLNYFQVPGYFEISEMFRRIQRLNGQELALLSTALMKNLFPKPQKGHLLVKDGIGDGSCILYFESSYFTQLTSAIRNSYNSGAFAKSNSEDDWNDFMYAVESAKPDISFDSTSLRPHFLSVE